MKSAINVLQSVLIALLLSIVSSGNSYSAESRFDANTLILSVPCVYLVDRSNPADPNNESLAYSLELLYDGQFLQVSLVSEIQRTEECSATFGVTSNIFTDNVRVGDEIYELILALEPGNFFSINEAVFLRRADSSLWRVSNGVNEVLIGGTIHVLRESDKPLPEIFEEAYSLAEILVTEVEYEDLHNVDAIVDLLLNPDGSTLTSKLSPSTYNSINTHLQSIGLPIFNVELLRPIWVAITLGSEEITRLGFGPGVDDHFQVLAQAQGKTNLGLETAVSQVLAVNQTQAHLTDDEIILQALEEINSGQLGPSIDALIRAWREGDVEYLTEELETLKAESLEDYNILFTNRNAAWVPQIEVFLTTPELELVLVGAFHLVGPESVLQMLEDLGYLISRY